MKNTSIKLFNESSLKIDLKIFSASAAYARKSIANDFNINFGWQNVVLMQTDAHTDLNIKYLGHDYATDILTFDYSEEDNINGEIYINSEVLQENALAYKVSVSNELNRLIIHGLLHLSGLNDHSEDEQRIMTMNEDKYLKLLETNGFM